MSIQAINWVLEDAPGLKPHLFGVLMGLANHADRDGRGSYPSQATLARYTRKADRNVRKDLAQLVEDELIRRGDQRLVGHLIADERPIVWDLAVERKQEGPDAGVLLTVLGTKKEPLSSPSDGHGPRATDPPQKNDHGVVDLWTAAGAKPDEREIIEKKIQTKNPAIGNLGAYVAAMHRSGDLAAMLAEIRHDRQAAQTRAAVATIRRMPACPHGEPGGDQPHPDTGQPMCPVCRDPQLAAQLAERDRIADAGRMLARTSSPAGGARRRPQPPAVRPSLARLLVDEQLPPRRPMPLGGGCCVTCAASGHLVTATDPVAGSYCPTHTPRTAGELAA